VSTPIGLVGCVGLWVGCFVLFCQFWSMLGWLVGWSRLIVAVSPRLLLPLRPPPSIAIASVSHATAVIAVD
jgi:hypothetical protein